MLIAVLSQNLLSDIKKKESELNNVSKNAQLYQQAVKDYENDTEKFKSILDLEDGLVPQTYKRSRLESPALRVKEEVRKTAPVAQMVPISLFSALLLDSGHKALVKSSALYKE
uniref:Uncharacterized protein n=1 Tax=Hucho hucho TaxID=62062 RepID=A0A4W5LJI3_9TELE